MSLSVSNRLFTACLALAPLLLPFNSYAQFQPIPRPIPLPDIPILRPQVFKAASSWTHNAWNNAGVSCSGRGGLGSRALERATSTLHLFGFDYEKLSNCNGTLEREYESVALFPALDSIPTGKTITKAELVFYVGDQFHSSAAGTGSFYLERVADNRIKPCFGHVKRLTENPAAPGTEGRPLKGVLASHRIERSAINGLTRVDVTRAVTDIYLKRAVNAGFSLTPSSGTDVISDLPGFQVACVNLIHSPELRITFAL